MVHSKGGVKIQQSNIVWKKKEKIELCSSVVVCALLQHVKASQACNYCKILYIFTLVLATLNMYSTWHNKDYKNMLSEQTGLFTDINLYMLPQQHRKVHGSICHLGLCHVRWPWGC